MGVQPREACHGLPRESGTEAEVRRVKMVPRMVQASVKAPRASPLMVEAQTLF